MLNVAGGEQANLEEIQDAKSVGAAISELNQQFLFKSSRSSTEEFGERMGKVKKQSVSGFDNDGCAGVVVSDVPQLLKWFCSRMSQGP